MLSTQMEERLNQHLNEEIYSSYLYLSMSAYFSAEGWEGFAHWMNLQTNEEHIHAMKIYGYLNEQGGRVKLLAVAEPSQNFKSPKEAFKQALAHEQEITKKINELVDLAIKSNDHATQIFLQWFVTEQVEEEANASQIVQSLDRIGDADSGLWMLDRKLAARQA